MLRRALVLALLCSGVGASGAPADVRFDPDGVLRVDADPGSRVAGTIRQEGPRIVLGAVEGLSAGPGCAPVAEGIACERPDGAEPTRIAVITGAGADALRVLGLAVRLDWQAGEGFDSLSAGTGAGGPVALRVSLDGIDNDAFGSAPANVAADVEDLYGGDGSDVLSGSSNSNDLAGGAGNDVLDGGAGYDTYDAGPGDDDVNARDGLPELVDCGDGALDRAILDAADQPVGCESVIADGTLAPDRDGDGVRTPADCDDTNAAVRPGAAEIADNGFDDDCAGGDAIDPDRDRDGVLRPQDCDDTAAAVRPGTPELPGNGRDDDCDGIQAPYPSIRVRLRQATGASAAGTRFVTLALSRLRAGDTILVTCRGRGCPFKRRLLPAPSRGGRLDVRRRGFSNRRIRAGGRVTIRVTDPRGVAKQFAFEMRADEAPIYVVRCASPPDNRLRRC